MRQLALCGVAIAALSGTSWAESGYLDVSRTNLEGEAFDVSVEGDSTAVSGAMNFGIRGRLEFQIDGQVATFDTDDAVEDYDDTLLGGTIHVFTRDPGWMYGAFVGGSELDDSNFTAAGIEGALYFERHSYSGAIAYVETDYDTDGVIIQQQLRYFAHRDFRLDAQLHYGSFETLGFEWDGLIYGLGAEYRIAASPMSFFAAYSHLSVSDVDLDADQITLGLRYNFDQDLAFRDESGASLLSVPRFGDLF